MTSISPSAPGEGAAHGQDPRRIVLLGGGFRPNGASGWRAGPLLRHLLELTGRERPRVCLMNTATGDDPVQYTRMYSALAGTGAELSHLALFPMPSQLEPGRHLLNQDLILVGGGSVANLAAVWHTHDLGPVFRQAWESGVILSGASAGAICWFEGGTTDSFGFDLRAFTAGLGLLAGSYCPHYDSEELRRPTFHRLVADGTLPGGWAADDGVGLRFDGTELVDVFRDRDGAAAYRVRPDGRGGVEEERLEARLLPTG
jgi:peptidase E